MHTVLIRIPRQMPFEYDVRESIQQSLVPEDQEAGDYPELDIELHDLKMQGYVSASWFVCFV